MINIDTNMTIGIYKIENKINKKIYVGQSINIEKRWKEHKYLLTINKPKIILIRQLFIIKQLYF